MSKTFKHPFNYFDQYNSPKWHFKHNFNFLPIKRKVLVSILDSMFELPKTLVNNIHFPKIKVALVSTLFAHHFYINTIHTLYVVSVYRNCFLFHVCFNSLKFENSFGQISRGLNLGAKQVRNTRGVTKDLEATVGLAYLTFLTANICIKLTKMNTKLSDRVYELTYSTNFGDLS